MILYKKDSSQKIRFLEIKTEGSDLVQISGVLDTDNPVKYRKTCKSKNVGKSNETTPEEQALSEMESKIRDKISEGYFKTKEECETEEVILPMLAKSYEDEKHKIDWSKDVFIQPKLDGMRCLAIIKDGKVVLKSRDGKIIENVDHIIKDLSQINNNVILDGELYCHGLSFQENMKLIKKYRKGETEQIKYHVYDIINNYCFRDRYEYLIFPLLTTYIEDVHTYEVKTEKELKQYHSKFIEEGYEGSIIRHGDKPYGVNKRCDSLLKYKDFQDIDAEIIDIEPAEQRPEWGVPVLKYNDKLFRSGVRMSHEDRIDMLKNKKDYIGKIANIRFFEMTDDGIPRFPVMVGIHQDRS